MNNEFLKFVDRIAQRSKNKALCEAVKKGYKICCESANATSLSLDSDPNYSVTIIVDSLDPNPVTFIVNAYDENDALDRVAKELRDHGYTGYIETDEPEFPGDYYEVTGGWIRADHVNIKKYDGKNIWVGMIPVDFTSYFANADASGLSDQDYEAVKELESELAAEGVNPGTIYPVFGPKGEEWNKNEQTREVLCSGSKF